MIQAVTKEKIKALLRAQVEYDPETAIADLEKGSVVPACELLNTIMADIVKRSNVMKNYSDKVVAVMGELTEQLS